MTNVTPYPGAIRSLCDVLVVEDDPIQAEEMAGFLGRARLVVEWARDGAEAFRLAETLKPRVAVLDYNLPDMTGANVAEKLALLSPATAIIMMSGRIDGLSEAALRDLGIIVFVNKPVPLGVLRLAVTKLVQGSPAGREAPRGPRGWLAAGLGSPRE